MIRKKEFSARGFYQLGGAVVDSSTPKRLNATQVQGGNMINGCNQSDWQSNPADEILQYFPNVGRRSDTGSPSLRRAVHSGAVSVTVIVVVVLVHGTLTPRPVLLGVEVVHVDLWQ